MSDLYLPGRGVVNLDCRRVDKAVNEYDARLFATQNPRNGMDCVFIKMSPFTDWMSEDGLLVIDGTTCVPVMGFPEGFPEPHVVIERLAKADALRRGVEILNDINRHNDALRAPARHAASERAGEVAEVAESAMHREGKARYHRSLRKRDPKHRG